MQVSKRNAKVLTVTVLIHAFLFSRIIDAGGFYLNQVRHSNTDQIIMPRVHVLPNDLTLVRVGKKNFYTVEWTF